MTKLRTVKAGETIGIASTGSPVAPECFHAGIEAIHKLGFKTKIPFDPSAYYGKSDYGFASESKETRARAFMELIEDESVAAIIAARGGYGTISVLPLLDYQAIARGGKLVVGYSDVTVLIAAISNRANIPTLHGPTISAEFARYADCSYAKESVDTLIAMMQDPQLRLQYPCEVIRDGEAVGKILAGNLTMLTTLLGTPWDLSYDGAILALEDVGEAPYRVHRALMQLKLAGKLRNLAGVVFGRFHNCQSSCGWSVEDVMHKSSRDIFDEANFPIYYRLEFGHAGKNLPLPLGCRARMLDGQLSMLDAIIR